MYVRHRARWGAHQGILIFKNNNRLLTFRVFVSKRVLSLYSQDSLNNVFSKRTHKLLLVMFIILYSMWVQASSLRGICSNKLTGGRPTVL